MKITITNKGGKKLFDDCGYSYYFDCEKDNIFKWRCTSRIKNKCTGKMETVINNSNHMIYKSQKHNHEPIAAEAHLSHADSDLKNLASTSMTPARIIREVTVNCDSDYRVYLPSKNAQKNKIKRIRKNYIIEPMNVDDIEIPNDLKFIGEELFVLAEKSFDNEKIIVLGTINGLKILGECKCWIMDGTFFVVPTIMAQLFSIHGMVETEIVPLIFCLMSKKSKAAYLELVYELHDLAVLNKINLNPERIITDFERTISIAAKEYFKNTDYKGCLFHFGQIIWRQVQKNHLVKKYGTSENFSLSIRMLKALAFVPSDEIPQYFDELNKSIIDNDAIKIFKWMKSTYKIKNNAKKGPFFDPNFWSIEDSGRKNFPRTQNSVESWHRRLKSITGVKNAKLYELIHNLKQEMIVALNTINKIKKAKVFQKKERIY